MSTAANDPSPSVNTGGTLPRGTRKVRLAIAGIGNCASSLVQGIEYYRNADPADRVPGLMHVVLGGYHVGDVEVVAAFDVDADKVGLDLSKAIGAGQNNTIVFSDVPELGIPVLRRLLNAETARKALDDAGAGKAFGIPSPE